MSAIETVIGQYRSGVSAVSSEAGEIGQDSSYRTNDDSSQFSDRNATSESDLGFHSFAAVPHPIQPDEVDALFAQWFAFMDDSRVEVKAGRLIDAASRAISDLWALLAHLPRGEDLSFSKEVGFKILSENPPGVIAGYLARLSERLQLWLARSCSQKLSSDIPVVIEWIARLRADLTSVLQQIRPSLASDPIASLDALTRRLGGEWEVALIEELQSAMSSEAVWDYPPTAVDNGGLLPHGPCRLSASFMDSVTSDYPRHILTTSWIRNFLSAVNDHCISQATKGTLWRDAYPTCLEVLTGHCANALVASMNSAWRQYKMRATAYGRPKPGVKLAFSFAAKKISGNPAESARKPPNLALENMLAFANEATLISVFCQHASANGGISVPLFRTCMEGISVTFANTANEVAKSLVRVHFSKKHMKLLAAAFEPKALTVRIKVPISDSLEAGTAFIASLPKMGSHDLVRYLVVGHVMQAVAVHYMQSLVKQRPKISKFTRLAAVVAEDEGLFFSVFRDLGRKPLEISSAIEQISHVRVLLNEKPDSAALVSHCIELTKVFPSSQKSLEVIKALLEMRGIGKSEKKDILYAVAACMHRNAESPVPVLDSSQEVGSSDTSHSSTKNEQDETF